MLTTPSPGDGVRPGLRIHHDSLRLETHEPFQFIDITDRVAESVRRSGVRNGLVNVQSKHTTAAIVVNENEPLLLEDMKRTLERLVPREMEYLHNNFEIRTANLSPDEDQNGHAHCKALFLGTSETLNIVNGTIQLGRWQRIFLVELDKARERFVSVAVIGGTL